MGGPSQPPIIISSVQAKGYSLEATESLETYVSSVEPLMVTTTNAAAGAQLAICDTVLADTPDKSNVILDNLYTLY